MLQQSGKNPLQAVPVSASHELARKTVDFMSMLQPHPVAQKEEVQTQAADPTPTSAVDRFSVSNPRNYRRARPRHKCTCRQTVTAERTCAFTCSI